VKVWDVATAKERKVLQQKPGLVPVLLGFSPDNRLVAGADKAGQVKVWQVTGTGKAHTLTGSKGAAALLFSDDHKLLAVKEKSGAVRLWNTDDGKLIAVLPAVDDLFFAPDGRTLATRSPNGTVRLWSAATGKRRATLQKPTLGAFDVALDPEGKV